MIEDLGTEPLTGRQLLLVEVDRAADVPATFPIAGSYFACLLAMDATELSDEEVYEVASRLLEAGCVYICCWGPQCERVHDIFDVADIDSAPDGPIAMTTGHADESLAEATWYLLVNTSPVHDYVAGCRTTVAIAIGSRDWASEIRAAFVAPSGFCARVVDD